MLKNSISYLLQLFYPFFKKIFTFQVFAYLVTGGANTILNMAIFAACITLFKANAYDVEIATLISFVITVFTGFWFSKNFTFQQEDTSKAISVNQFKKYSLVALQGQVNGYLLTKGIIYFLKLKPILAYIITAIIMLTINFFLQKYYSFKQKSI